MAQLRDGELHIALTVQPGKKLMRNLNFKLLASYSMCIAVAPTHPLAKLKSVPMARLTREPLIGYSRVDYPDYHEHIEALFAPVGRPPRVSEEHDGIASVIAAVEAGRGFALVPDSFACMVGPRLTLIPLKPRGDPILVGAAWNKGAVVPLVDKFVEAASGAA